MLTNLPTPAVLVDWSIAEKNIAYMQSRADSFGVALRPHIKTHKNLEVGRAQLAAGAAGITCAKVSEAKVFVDAGFDDVFVAYPVVGEYQVAAIMQLAARCRLSTAIDSIAGAERLQRAAAQANSTLDVMLIVDSGGGRDGVDSPEAAAPVAAALKGMPNLRLIGVMTHEGHAFGIGMADGPGTPAERVQIEAQKVGERLVAVAEYLKGQGFSMERVSTGATPTCWVGKPVPGITEWRPGTYVYNDIQECSVGVPEEACAVWVEAMIVSHPQPDRYIMDAGAKTLSQAHNDRFGYGPILDHAEASIVALTEEHGTIRAPEGAFTVGQRIRIRPIHVCTTVNMHDHIWRWQAEQDPQPLTVDARGCVV